MIQLRTENRVENNFFRALFKLGTVRKDKPEPEAQVVVFQTIEAAPALVGLGFSDRHAPFHQMQLLQSLEVGGDVIQAGGLLDLVLTGLAGGNRLAGLQNSCAVLEVPAAGES